MKLSANQIAGVLKNSAPYCGLLVYGEDWGLVRERALAAVRGVLGGDADAFRLARLTREEHGRLRDEASGLALGGGRRVIHVQDAVDGLVAGLEKLKLRPADTLVVLEAGELSPRSKLRSYVEKQQNWAAIPCYMSNASKIGGEIQAFLRERGVSATPDALAYLAEELAGESVTRQSELEKLFLFAGDGTIDVKMAQLSSSRSIEASLASAVSAALAGQSGLTDSLLAQLGLEGATGAGLLAVMSAQVHRLLKVRLLVDSGQSPEDACRSLMPPMYPRQIAPFVDDVRRWRASSLEVLGRAIREADMACKCAGSPDLAIAGRLLAAVAARGPART